jgi:hypothetical protein
MPLYTPMSTVRLYSKMNLTGDSHRESKKGKRKCRQIYHPPQFIIDTTHAAWDPDLHLPSHQYYCAWRWHPNHALNKGGRADEARTFLVSMRSIAQPPHPACLFLALVGSRRAEYMHDTPPIRASVTRSGHVLTLMLPR